MFVYVHIPFCRQKCTYCKFALSPLVRQNEVEKYLRFLRVEIADFFKENPTQTAQSVYFGGGTPSILNAKQLQNLLDLVPKTANCEITLEANAEDITEAYVKDLEVLGVNRISLGVQTLNNQSLAEIGRNSTNGIFNALECLAKSTIKTVNADFIIGLPFVRKGEILRNVQTVLSRFRLNHISVYMLESGKYPPNYKTAITETEICDDYWQIADYLEKI